MPLRPVIAGGFVQVPGAGAGSGDVIASGTLANNAIVLGGGTTTVKTTTTGTGIVTALGVNVGSAGAPVLFDGAGGTPSSMVGTNITGTAAGLTAGVASAVAVGGITGLGTNVATALAINVGSAGAPVVLNGDGGTPSSMTGTNFTGTAAGLTAGVASAVAISGLTAGTLAALLQLGEGAGNIALDETLSADGAYSGITQAGTAGATLAFGDLCYFAAADSRWELTDASAAATSGDVQLGFCVLAAAADGDPTRMLFFGKIRADTAFPSFTVGVPVYVSETAGDVTATAPVTTDSVTRRVGFAQTADAIWVNISPDYLTHV